jgi:hypothetical protein
MFGLRKYIFSGRYPMPVSAKMEGNLQGGEWCTHRVQSTVLEFKRNFICCHFAQKCANNFRNFALTPVVVLINVFGKPKKIQLK